VKIEGLALDMVVREQASKQHKVALMNGIGKSTTYSSFDCKENFSCYFEFTSSAKLFLLNS